MISSHHRSHVVDKGTGSCCCSPIRLAHLGEISLRVNASCSSFFSKAICFCTIVLLCFFQYLKIATKVLHLYMNKHLFVPCSHPSYPQPSFHLQTIHS